MFERYTERARRTLFFARFEAAQLGSASIESVHLLLGIIREGKGTTARILSRTGVSLEGIRRQVDAPNQFVPRATRDHEIPFSADFKQVLTCAADAADHLSSKAIGTEHLLLGILTAGPSAASDVLERVGLTADRVRAEIIALGSAGTHGDEGSPDGSTLRIRTTSRAGGQSSAGGPDHLSLDGFTLKAALAELTGILPSRIEFAPAVDDEIRYDLSVSVPGATRSTIHDLLRAGVEAHCRVKVRRDDRPVDTYVVTAPEGLKSTPAIRPSASAGGGFAVFSQEVIEGPGAPSKASVHARLKAIFAGQPLDQGRVSGTALSATAITMDGLCEMIEPYLARPVVNETGLGGEYDLDLSVQGETAADMIAALGQALGLVLSAERRGISRLVVTPVDNDA